MAMEFPSASLKKFRPENNLLPILFCPYLMSTCPFEILSEKQKFSRIPSTHKIYQ